MTNEERKDFYMKRNVKLYPIFGALTWDVIFVWTISTLFFTTQKGLTNSQVIMLDSILMIFGCIMVVPVSKIFQNVSALKSARIGNLGYVIYLLLCIFGENYLVFAFAQFFLAFGYAVNGVKSNTILIDSLHEIKRGQDYQRVYGKGMSLFYVLESIGAIFVTMIYAWQPYLTYWISVGISLSLILFTFLMNEPSKFQKQNVDIQSIEKPEVKTKKPDSYLKILKSGFFIAMLAYMFLFRGILSIVGSSFKIYLQQTIELGIIPVWLFGIIYGMGRLMVALSCKYQFKFDLKFGVKSLIIFNIVLIATFFINGFVYLNSITSIVSVVIIIICSYLQQMLRTPNQIFMNNYMQVCMPKRNFERAMAIRIMVEYLGYAIISAIYATLLEGFGDNYGLTSAVYMGIFAIPVIVSLVVFIRLLVKKHAQKYTVIKEEYTKD